MKNVRVFQLKLVEASLNGRKIYRMSHLMRHPQLFHIMRPLKLDQMATTNMPFKVSSLLENLEKYIDTVIYRFRMFSLFYSSSTQLFVCWCLNRNNNKMMPLSWLPVFDFYEWKMFYSRILIEWSTCFSVMFPLPIPDLIWFIASDKK